MLNREEAVELIKAHPRAKAFHEFTLIDLLQLTDEEEKELSDLIDDVTDETFESDMNGVADWLEQHKKITIDIS